MQYLACGRRSGVFAWLAGLPALCGTTCFAGMLMLSVPADVSCDEWAFSLLPLDVDLLSMELPEFFRDYFLEGDQRWINTVAQALHLLSTLYGPFPNCYGIGRCAKVSTGRPVVPTAAFQVLCPPRIVPGHV